MTKVIKIIDAKNIKLESRSHHHTSLIGLTTTIQCAENSSHEKLICDFIKSWKFNEKKPRKPLGLFIDITGSDLHLQSLIAAILKALSVKSHANIMQTLEDTWPEDIDAILRLQHIFHLTSFWAKQSPTTSFSKIIPPAAVYHFLKNCEKT